MQRTNIIHQIKEKRSKAFKTKAGNEEEFWKMNKRAIGSDFLQCRCHVTQNGSLCQSAERSFSQITLATCAVGASYFEFL